MYFRRPWANAVAPGVAVTARRVPVGRRAASSFRDSRALRPSIYFQRVIAVYVPAVRTFEMLVSAQTLDLELSVEQA
jgi:hypothetical protein